MNEEPQDEREWRIAVLLGYGTLVSHIRPDGREVSGAGDLEGTVTAVPKSRLEAERTAREQAERGMDALGARLNDAERDRERAEEAQARAHEVQEALASQGLPADASVDGLIRHHRANAELAGALAQKAECIKEVKRYREALEKIETTQPPDIDNTGVRLIEYLHCVREIARAVLDPTQPKGDTDEHT